MPNQERVLLAEPPRRRHWPLACAAAFAAVVSTIWGYLEYAGQARPSLLALALTGTLLGVGLTVHFGSQAVFVFETIQAPRPAPPPPEQPLELGTEALGPGARRGFIALLGGAAASLLGFLLLPLRSLGSTPEATLTATAWRRGVRLVTAEGGLPLRPADLPSGSATAVMPEDARDSANSVATVLRLQNGDLYAYSRICTHAGCSVCVFKSREAELVCPCHFSVFDAANKGRVLSGPAGQALPQLPLRVDDAGYLAADGDFSGPVGPRCG